MVRVCISALLTILMSKLSLEFCISVKHSIWICGTHVTYGFMKVYMTFLLLPCHGIDFILSASSLRLMISQHTTIDGKMTNMHALENCLKKWTCKMQNAGFPRHYLPLMKNLVFILWCNWLQTVQPQQASEVWIIVLQLVWFVNLVHLLHIAVCWETWGDCWRSSKVLCHWNWWVH